MRVAIIAVALALALAAAGCGSGSSSGTSSPATNPSTTQAKTKACDAIDNVKTHVSMLHGATNGSVSPSDALKALQGLQNDLATIRAQASKLSGTVRTDLQNANAAFSQQLTAITNSVTSMSSGQMSAAASKLSTATHKLAADYNQALSGLNC